MSCAAIPVECKFCGMQFSSVTSKKKGHTCLRHQCPKCVLKFETQQQLKEHMESHKSRFHCSDCDIAPFRSENALTEHKSDAHGVLILCPHCSTSFQRVVDRDRHVKNKHTAETANRCACGRTYVRMIDLKTHEETCVASSAGAAKAVKRKCDALFSEKKKADGENPEEVMAKALEMVRNEARAKIDEQNSWVQCTLCGKTYSNNESLKRHRREAHPRFELGIGA